MSFVKLSGKARLDLRRLYDFLTLYDISVAERAKNTIIAGLEVLETRPAAGSPVADRPHVKKLVIDFGASGYLVFHKRYEKLDMNLITRIIHQKEWYSPETIGLAEEKTVERK